jgi:hypothetical protein
VQNFEKCPKQTITQRARLFPIRSPWSLHKFHSEGMKLLRKLAWRHFIASIPQATTHINCLLVRQASQMKATDLTSVKRTKQECLVHKSAERRRFSKIWPVHIKSFQLKSAWLSLPSVGKKFQRIKKYILGPILFFKLNTNNELKSIIHNTYYCYVFFPKHLHYI